MHLIGSCTKNEQTKLRDLWTRYWLIYRIYVSFLRSEYGIVVMLENVDTFRSYMLHYAEISRCEVSSTTHIKWSRKKQCHIPVEEDGANRAKGKKLLNPRWWVNTVDFFPFFCKLKTLKKYIYLSGCVGS